MCTRVPVQGVQCVTAEALCVWVCMCVGWGGRALGPPAPEGEVSALRDSLACPGSAPSAGTCGRRGAALAVLPPSARAVCPLAASGPRARGSAGQAGTPGARLPPEGTRTPPAGRRGEAVGSRTVRPTPEARPAAEWGRGGRRARGPLPATALVGSTVWRVEHAGARDWRWERAVGVDCSAPEPRCLWLPYLNHSDRRASGSRRVRVSTEGVVTRGRGRGLGSPRGKVCVCGTGHQLPAIFQLCAPCIPEPMPRNGE